MKANRCYCLDFAGEIMHCQRYSFQQYTPIDWDVDDDWTWYSVLHNMRTQNALESARVQNGEQYTTFAAESSIAKNLFSLLSRS